MSEAEFDQRGWFRRIGYSGPTTPTLATLNRLILAHSHSIPYETLDIMLGRPPKLDMASLQSKMITGERGGYCFEQNMFFRAGLRSLGYRITSLQGRVVRGIEIDAKRPAIHMLLQVELPEGPYLADVGFGNLAPTSALLLAPQIEQETPHEVMRFIDVGGELTLQARFKHGCSTFTGSFHIRATTASTKSPTGTPQHIPRRRIKATSLPRNLGRTGRGSQCTMRASPCVRRMVTQKNAGLPPMANSETCCGVNSD